MHELFGTKNWGVNNGLLMLGAIIGNYVLVTLLAGNLYEKHTVPGTTECFGEMCYRDTFFIISGICGMAFIVNGVLSLRTRSLYDRFEEAKGHIN